MLVMMNHSEAFVNMFQVWSGEMGVHLAKLGCKDYGVVKSVVFDALGQFVAAGYHSGHVRLFAVETGTFQWQGF
jgi:hypothetical protein